MSSVLVNSLHKHRRCAVALKHSIHNLIHNPSNIQARSSIFTASNSVWIERSPGILGHESSNSHLTMHGLSRRQCSAVSKEPGKMARVTEKIKMNYPRRKVWTVLSDFGNLDWQHNTIDSVNLIGDEGIGQIRSINIKGISHPIKEKLVKMDHDNFEFEIEVDHGWVLPFGNYTCKCKVERIDTKTCTIVWIGEFEVLGMEEETGAKMAAGIYKQMFVDLPRYMEKKGY